MQLYRYFDSAEGDIRQYTSSDFSQVLERFLRDGYIPEIDDELGVAVDSGLTVDVGAGEAMIQGRWYKNTETEQVELDTADPSDARIDRIVLRLDLSSEERNILIQYKAGTPGSGDPPALTRDATTHEISLAKISVGAGVGTITSGNIIDERDDIQLCGRAIAPNVTRQTIKVEDEITLAGGPINIILDESLAELEHKNYAFSVYVVDAPVAVIHSYHTDSEIGLSASIVTTGGDNEMFNFRRVLRVLNLTGTTRTFKFRVWEVD